MVSDNSNQTFTLSKLQMYDECPQKYKLCYIDNVPVLEKPFSNEASKTGNNLHNIINYYLKGQDITKLLNALTPIETDMWNNFKNNAVLKYQFLKSEYAFNVKIQNYWFTGRIDALFKDTLHDEFIILDWKTSENFNGENASFQTAFYLLCLHEILKSVNYIKTPAQLSLHYMNLSTDSTVKIKLVKELLNQYAVKILTIAEKINNDTNFFCNKTDKCKICKYSRSCAYF